MNHESERNQDVEAGVPLLALDSPDLEEDEIEVLYWSASPFKGDSFDHVALRTRYEYLSYYPQQRGFCSLLLGTEADVYGYEEDTVRSDANPDARPPDNRVKLKGFDVDVINNEIRKVLTTLIKHRWSLCGVGNSNNCAQEIFYLLEKGGLDKFYLIEKNIRKAIQFKIEFDMGYGRGYNILRLITLFLMLSVLCFLILLSIFCVDGSFKGDLRREDMYSNYLCGFFSTGLFFSLLSVSFILSWPFFGRLSLVCGIYVDQPAEFLLTPKQLFGVVKRLSVYSGLNSNEDFYYSLNESSNWFRRQIFFALAVLKENFGYRLCKPFFRVFSDHEKELIACQQIIDDFEKAFDVFSSEQSRDYYLYELHLVLRFIHNSRSDLKYAIIDDFLNELQVDLKECMSKNGITEEQIQEVANRFERSSSTPNLLSSSTIQSSLFYHSESEPSSRDESDHFISSQSSVQSLV